MIPAQRQSARERSPDPVRRKETHRLQLVVGHGSACPRRLLEDNAEWIAATTRKIARSSHLSPEESEDFGGWAFLRLMRKDFALLRACRDPRSARAYLLTVLRNLVRDYRNHIWGKWRPSTRARELGPDAVALERLCHRDGLTQREAVRILGHGKAASELEILENLVVRLPTRLRREHVELDAEKTPASPWKPGCVEDSEDSRLRIETVLSHALASIGETDRRILFLHFVEGHTMAWIARSLELPQRSLYTRRDSCLRLLLRCFEKHGWTWAEVAPLFETRDGALGLERLFRGSGGSPVQ